MTTQTDAAVTMADPDARDKVHIARVLLAGYAAVSVLTLLAIVVFSSRPDTVTGPVWVRGVILAITSVITYAIGASMARGSRRNYRRVQIIATAQLVAIIVIESVPGGFPIWFKIENGVCGALLLIVVLVTFTRSVRGAFATT